MKHRRLYPALLLGVCLWSAPTDALECGALTQTLPKARIDPARTTHSAAYARLNELVYRANYSASLYSYRKEVALLNAVAETLQPHLPAHAQVGTFRFIVLKPHETYGDAGVHESGLIVFSAATIHTSPSIDALAVIVAHEIAHLALAHLVSDEVQRERVLLEYREVSALRHQSMDVEQLRRLDERALDLLTQLFSREALWRRLEFEADLFAAHMARHAGYDTGVLAQVLRENANTEVDITDALHPRASVRAALFSCFAQAPDRERTYKLEAELQRLKKRRGRTHTPR